MRHWELGVAKSTTSGKVAIFYSWKEVSGLLDDKRISEISYFGNHSGPICGGSAYCRSVGIDCDIDLRFSTRLQTVCLLC